MPVTALLKAFPALGEHFTVLSPEVCSHTKHRVSIQWVYIPLQNSNVQVLLLWGFQRCKAVQISLFLKWRWDNQDRNSLLWETTELDLLWSWGRLKTMSQLTEEAWWVTVTGVLMLHDAAITLLHGRKWFLQMAHAKILQALFSAGNCTSVGHAILPIWPIPIK